MLGIRNYLFPDPILAPDPIPVPYPDTDPDQTVFIRLKKIVQTHALKMLEAALLHRKLSSHFSVFCLENFM